ncbi:HI1506-related protein [Actinobacillus seminis]|uniref:HI1506-related protein n=1 Tax=Actinobacillus seminis TaxID=722 RepID=UPI003B940BD3
MEQTNDRYQVVVHNKIKDGYRRAGFSLQKGENLLIDVTHKQLEQLKADPRLIFVSQNPMLTESIKDTEKPLSTEGNLSNLTVAKLQEKLTKLGVEFDKSAKKADLVTALETALVKQSEENAAQKEEDE